MSLQNNGFSIVTSQFCNLSVHPNYNCILLVFHKSGSEKVGLNYWVQIHGFEYMGPKKWVQIIESEYVSSNDWVQIIESEYVGSNDWVQIIESE